MDRLYKPCENPDCKDGMYQETSLQSDWEGILECNACRDTKPRYKIKSGQVVLLDMDGTITEPRGKIEYKMSMALLELAHYAEIGIVTGSGINYVLEQCGSKLGNLTLNRKTTLLPCNGTQVYKHMLTWDKIFSVSMREQLGNVNFGMLLGSIFAKQFEIIKSYPDLKFSGSFVTYRDSMINWSPTGRDGSQKDREVFVSHPDNLKIRKELIDYLTGAVDSKVEFALGGQTSIDIYPEGWNKTFALQHFKNKECWFIGDRCEPGQNDYHIWKELNKKKKSFKTTGPDMTIDIIRDIIKVIREG